MNRINNRLAAPERIRVGQDADGFWSCREAVSGSPEYVRADLCAPVETGRDQDPRFPRLLSQEEINIAMEDYPRPMKPESIAWRYVIGCLVGAMIGLCAGIAIGMVFEKAIANVVHHQLEEYP